MVQPTNPKTRAEIPAGTKFGRLTVLRRIPGTDKHGFRVYDCQCVCGNTTQVTANSLKTGHTKSCGCFMRDRARELVVQRSTTHGFASRDNPHPLYFLWYGMIERCTNPKLPGYKNYGGRGIRVCDRWLGPDGFPNFLADMGERPEGRHGNRPAYTIDRIDVEGNYEPANCRWATWDVQSNNKRPRAKRICSVEGCDRRHFGLGLCQAHYFRQRNNGDLDLDTPIRPHVRKRA